MMKNLVEIYANQVVVNSRDVARNFEKAHQHILCDILRLQDVSIFGQMFHKTSIPDSYGRQQPAYLMNQDGFSLLVMGFTGKKALQWKIRYIQEFNKMKKQLETGMLPQRHEIVKKTYRGKLVMSVVDMASLLNTAYYNIYGLLKNNNINYTVLKSRDMVEFKRENQGKIDPFITNMIIIDQMQAYRLAKCERCNQAVFEALKDYFGEFKREIPMVVDVDNKQLVEYIQEVRNYIVAMNVILDTLGQYQTEQDFNERENTLSHVVGNLFGKVHSFKRTTKKLIPAPAGLLL